MKPKYSHKELLAMKEVLLVAQEIEPLAYVSLLINNTPGKRGLMFYTGIKELDEEIRKKISKVGVNKEFKEGTLILYSLPFIINNSQHIVNCLRGGF